MMHSPSYHRSLAVTNAKTADVPQQSLDWLDCGAWRLPSGKALSEFALQSGFLVPHLFAADGHSSSIGSLTLARETGKRVA